jgi:outer membrane protein OmpA-like peptidoglycan-associated protein
MKNLKQLILIQLFVTLIFPVTLRANSCEQADSLVTKVLNRHPPNSKRLLQRALTFCPRHAIVRNTLAVIFEDEGDYTNALFHYQQMVKYHSDSLQAWMGLGDIYYRQKQFPLSLEAYLQVCSHYQPQRDLKESLLKRTRQRVAELKSRLRDVEAGNVLKYESLSLLYDKARLAELYEMATLCYVKSGKSWVLDPGDNKAWVSNVVRFHNLNFETGEYDLTLQADSQLDEIAFMIDDEHLYKDIRIMGHADIQAWAGSSSRKSKALNDELSRVRAESVRDGLIKRGFSKSRLKIYSYGSSKSLVSGKSEEALAQNRRVEIEVSD